MADFTCESCGSTFSLHERVLDRYPGWTPRLCQSCRDEGGASSAPVVTDGDPDTGVFTDGACAGNPGPG
ncbi:MAG: hypothetical protein O6705_04620, partial [Actinobacteria bacterium]|nr:hypothetical protein [Actinomycetota bacterium]